MRTTTTVLIACGLCAGILGSGRPLAGQAKPDTVRTYTLEPLVVEGRADDLTSTAPSASVGWIGHRDLGLRPRLREAELLEAVPGMILTQHSGDGKANQMFVRGFNLDHGTDFATFVEGMPVNIPSHAHGQGYTDLNFIVPELVENVEYELGPYYADVGDFSGAGSARVRLRRSVPRPMAGVGYGQDGFRRVVVAASPEVGGGTLLAGGELKGYDGPWARPEDLQKASGALRYSWGDERSLFSVLALGYANRWAASDQIPRRAVESGTLDRFGQIDRTLGGSTSRYSLSGSWERSGGGSSVTLDAYAIRYALDLFSDFTYHLDDPQDGDQIRQQDRGRWMAGAHLAEVLSLPLLGLRNQMRFGAQVQSTGSDVALSHTHERAFVSLVREDRVRQWSGGLYGELTTYWTPSVRTIVGVRGDLYEFDVASDRPENAGSRRAARVSPKASLVVTPWSGTELYASAGFGFHSNDARGTVKTVDPSTGDPTHPVDALVPSRGAEIGVRSTPRSGWRATAALWTVQTGSELLFVGDAGTTEPGDASRRVGVTMANFYRLSPRLTADLDLSFTRARFFDVEQGGDRVPGAVENVIAAGLTWEPQEAGLFGALRLRHLGPYALTEDDAHRAAGSSLVNLDVGWLQRNVRVGVALLNALDARSADIAYYYRSRLEGEPAGGLEDVHFHPTEPRQLRLFVMVGG